jgi:hypothetical protein
VDGDISLNLGDVGRNQWTSQNQVSGDDERIAAPTE